METVIAGKIRRMLNVIDIDIVESINGGFFFNVIIVNKDDQNDSTITSIKNTLNQYDWEMTEWFFEYYRIQFFAHER